MHTTYKMSPGDVTLDTESNNCQACEIIHNFIISWSSYFWLCLRLLPVNITFWKFKHQNDMFDLFQESNFISLTIFVFPWSCFSICLDSWFLLVLGCVCSAKYLKNLIKMLKQTFEFVSQQLHIHGILW